MDRTLSFCMVTSFYPPYSFGGDGRFVHELSKELARRGHTVDVITCSDAFRALAGRRPAVSERVDDPGIRVHRLQSRLGVVAALAAHQLGRPVFHRRRLRKLFEEPYDVIHYHNISLVGGPDILRWGNAVKLYTPHEFWLVCPAHVLFRANRGLCNGGPCLTCGIANGRPPQVWRWAGAIRRAVRHVDAFVTPSRFVAEKHQEMGLDLKAEHLLHFVPDSSVEPEANLELASNVGDGPFFLFVGRLEKIKGLHQLIPLFRRLPSARLVVAGAGSEADSLKNLALDCENIVFLGHVSGSALRSLYRRATALIVPSICYEVFGLVIAEALIEGTPVLVRDLGAMPELVDYSGGGVVWRDEEELFGLLVRFLSEPERASELGTRGRFAAGRLFTVDAHLEGYLAIIDRLLAERSGMREL